ncbi:hypothetical protein LTS18_000862, partial [Coniosporium uncinatum]
MEETFVPTETRIGEGKTSAPGYLTEAELIALMDANGVGTDATMAEHIGKIKERRGGGSTGGVQEFIPTTLGVALIEGYDNLEFKTSLGKPFLREEMELQTKAICEGRSTKADVVHQSLEQYREVFIRTNQQIAVLKD